MYGWIVYLHVAGIFVFLLGHGASANVAFALRRERTAERIRALLDLSLNSYVFMYVGLLLLLVSGIVAGFMGNHWGRGWIWASIVIFIVIFVGMYALGSAPLGRVRQAVGLQPYRRTGQVPLGEVKSEAELSALLNTNQPMFVMVLGLGGLLIILWLMMFKPF